MINKKVILSPQEYTWVCPICGEKNWTVEKEMWVECPKCQRSFEVENYES
jgi:transposase-like protein